MFRMPATLHGARRRSVGADDFQQFVAETVQLARAHARNAAQILNGIGAVAGNFGQRRVVENDVGRHAVALRSLRAPRAQPLPARRFARTTCRSVGSARSLVRLEDWRVRVGFT